MAELFFYTNPMSRGQIARWMIEEVGAPYEERLVEYGEAMKGPEYRAVNPMGKVPAIVHDGHTVTECAAICAYLAEAYPEAGLAPRDEERAAYHRWLFFPAGPLGQAMVNHSMGWEAPEDKQATVGYGHFELVVDVLAGWLESRDYICGECFTAADVYVGAQVVWGLQFGRCPPTLPSRPMRRGCANARPTTAPRRSTTS